MILSTTRSNSLRFEWLSIWRSLSMSDWITAGSTSWNMSPAAWMRWVEVRRLRIISCKARCMLGYPS